jgi:hypothetical protein
MTVLVTGISTPNTCLSAFFFNSYRNVGARPILFTQSANDRVGKFAEYTSLLAENFHSEWLIVTTPYCYCSVIPEGSSRRMPRAQKQVSYE